MDIEIKDAYLKILDVAEEEDKEGKVNSVTIKWDEGALYGFIAHDIGMTIVCVESSGTVDKMWIPKNVIPQFYL